MLALSRLAAAKLADSMDRLDWAELHRQHRARVYGLCLRILDRPEEAEEAASDAFVRAQRAASSYDPGRPFASWILTIASRVAIDRLRRRGREAKLFLPLGAVDTHPFEPGSAAPGPLDRALAKERVREVRAGLQRLKRRDRIVLVLRYYAELDYEQIGDILEISRPHVGALLFRAKKRLRREVTNTGGKLE